MTKRFPMAYTDRSDAAEYLNLAGTFRTSAYCILTDKAFSTFEHFIGRDAIRNAKRMVSNARHLRLNGDTYSNIPG